MSGVYIPNMKMPESCDVCWAEYAYEICNSHSENCPLIPVPDHGDWIRRDAYEYPGDLIDRDAYEYPADLMDEPVVFPKDKEDV